MTALPLPPLLSRRYYHEIGGRFFLTVSTKMHFCEEKFNIRK
jgi:hypothetical protein